MPPTVSVLMPVLNARPFLPEAIDSILAQTLADLELIVVDDGSDDGSLDLARGYERLDARVRVIALKRDPATQSGARAANVGLGAARGDYVARMDADDISPPDRLAMQLAWLTERDLDVIGGQAERFGDRSGSAWLPETHDAIASELPFRSPMVNATLFARSHVLKAARWDEREAGDEYDLITRLVGSARLGNSPGLALRYRYHAAQSSWRLSAPKRNSAWRRQFAYFFERYPDATLADFRAVRSASWAPSPLVETSELERLGGWLVRLSRLPEEGLRRRMARRWDEACDRFAGDAADAVLLHESYRQRIVAAP